LAEELDDPCGRRPPSLERLTISTPLEIHIFRRIGRKVRGVCFGNQVFPKLFFFISNWQFRETSKRIPLVSGNEIMFPDPDLIL
jgi:hypothetical protein